MSRLSPKSPRLPARLGLEQLEERVTPVAPLMGPWVTFAAGKLTVRGGLADDRIIVKQQGNRLWVAGSEAAFDVKDVRRVDVYGGAGDDYIEFDGGNSVGKQKFLVALFGEDGDDTLVGGTGGETLRGGAGNDVLDGGLGNDVLFGDAGGDTLIGGIGSDNLNGGDGNDVLFGGQGADFLRGGAGDDRFYGGEGRDTFKDDFVPDRWVVGGYSPLDVQQGSGGTCAVLATLAAAATAPGSLSGRISYAGNNTYKVKLHSSWFFGLFHSTHTELVQFDGTWYDHDALPTMARDEDGTPNGPATGEFWTTLFQRAVLQQEGVNWRDAKVVENWSTTEAAAHSSVLGDRTWHSIRPGETTLPTQLRSDLRAGSILTASTPGWGKDAAGNEIVERDGIISKHAYAVLDVYQQGGAWRVLLYNPWGWDASGDAPDGRDDGLVDIDWQTFVKNFDMYCRTDV